MGRIYFPLVVDLKALASVGLHITVNWEASVWHCTTLYACVSLLGCEFTSSKVRVDLCRVVSKLTPIMLKRSLVVIQLLGLYQFGSCSRLT